MIEINHLPTNIEVVKINNIENNFFLQSEVLKDLWQLTIIKQGQLKLEIQYNYSQRQFLILNGIIGKLMQESNLSLDEKLQRCYELMQHSIMDYESKNLVN